MGVLVSVFWKLPVGSETKQGPERRRASCHKNTYTITEQFVAQKLSPPSLDDSEQTEKTDGRTTEQQHIKIYYVRINESPGRQNYIFSVIGSRPIGFRGSVLLLWEAQRGHFDFGKSSSCKGCCREFKFLRRI